MTKTALISSLQDRAQSHICCRVIGDPEYRVLVLLEERIQKMGSHVSSHIGTRRPNETTQEDIYAETILTTASLLLYNTLDTDDVGVFLITSTTD